MTDPFLNLKRPPRVVPAGPKNHEERAHSKFSASGAERYFECTGSVALSEGLPNKSNSYAQEGTYAHEIVEDILVEAIAGDLTRVNTRPINNYPLLRHLYGDRGVLEMIRHAEHGANFILGQHVKNPGADIMVETRVYLDFIHPEMFGTFDGAVVDYFGTLHVFDFKYGIGVPVSPIKNLQMIFYGLGLAHRYHWNFKRVRLWIIQPRIKNYEGPIYWELPTSDLKAYVDVFRRAVERVEKYSDVYTEGSWCHWCRAKSICPLKRERKFEKAKSVFSISPIEKG